MRWELSNKFDPRAAALADRHYNRRKVGSPQFAPPGRSLVLFGQGEEGAAFWITSWPFAQYVRHAWAGAWVCSAFRNEGLGLSSELIREALAATVWKWPEIPDLGMVTFVNTEKVRRKRDPGRCYRKAGFRPIGHTAGGLVALGIGPDEMPEPCAPIIRQQTLPGIAP